MSILYVFSLFLLSFHFNFPSVFVSLFAYSTHRDVRIEFTVKT